MLASSTVSTSPSHLGLQPIVHSMSGSPHRDRRQTRCWPVKVRQVSTAFVPPALGKPMWRSSIRHMPGRYRSGIDQRPRCRPAAHTRSIVRALSSVGTRAPATTRSGARSISLRATRPRTRIAWSPDDPLGQADCPQRPPAGRQRELALSTRHRSHSLEQARGTHCGSAALLARRVPNGSLATSVSCRVDGAAALSVRRA